MIPNHPVPAPVFGALLLQRELADAYGGGRPWRGYGGGGGQAFMPGRATQIAMDRDLRGQLREAAWDRHDRSMAGRMMRTAATEPIAGQTPYQQLVGHNQFQAESTGAQQDLMRQLFGGDEGVLGKLATLQAAQGNQLPQYLGQQAGLAQQAEQFDRKFAFEQAMAEADRKLKEQALEIDRYQAGMSDMGMTPEFVASAAKEAQNVKGQVAESGGVYPGLSPMLDVISPSAQNMTPQQLGDLLQRSGITLEQLREYAAYKPMLHGGLRSPFGSPLTNWLFESWEDMAARERRQALVGQLLQRLQQQPLPGPQAPAEPAPTMTAEPPPAPPPEALLQMMWQGDSGPKLNTAPRTRR